VPSKDKYSTKISFSGFLARGTVSERERGGAGGGKNRSKMYFWD